MRLTVALGAAAAALVCVGTVRGEEDGILLPPVPVGASAARDTLPDAPVPVDAGETPATADAGEDATDTPPPEPAVEQRDSVEGKTAPEGAAPWIPEVIGDQAPVGTLIRLPSGRVHGQGALYVPSARYFKISDDNSPRPDDRTDFTFNYFYDLGDTVNRLAGGGIEHTRIHREIFGWEWADKEQTFSVGLRLPIQTYNASGFVRGLDGASTDIGDLTVFFKQVVWQDTATGSLVSAGLAVTPPTGPSPFAGSRDLAVFHNTCLQPFCGWIWSHDRFYVQGFTAVDAPTDLNDVVLLSNSVAAGYFLYQSLFDNGKTAIIPTVELHVHDPLNHRGVLGLNDPAGTPDMVDVTGGVQFEYLDKSSIALAFAVPVAGPRLFDFEVLAQFRWRY